MTEANIIDAFNNVVPLSQTSPEKIEAIRDWGKERAVPGLRQAHRRRGTAAEERQTPHPQGPGLNRPVIFVTKEG